MALQGIQTVATSSFSASTLNSPLLSSRSSISIGEFLITAPEVQKYFYFLQFIGAFYCPDAFSHGNVLTNLWKCFLILWVVGFITFGIYVFILFVIVITSNSFFYCLWAFSILLQGFICVPVLMNIRKRFHNIIDHTEQLLFIESLYYGQIYMIICVLLIILFTISLILLLTKDQPLWMFITEALFGFCPIAISCISTWGLIFILFDCSVINKEITTLHSMVNTNNSTLNCHFYNQLYNKLKILNSESIMIADGIALIAYFNIVVFFFTFFVTTKWNNIVGSICLCFREVLLLMFVLPNVALINDHYDKFCSYLINNNNIWNSPGITLLTNTHPPSIDINQQLEYLRLYTIMTIDKPLSMTILSRRIKKLEMKAQVITISLIVCGTCLSIVLKHILGVPNQYD